MDQKTVWDLSAQQLHILHVLANLGPTSGAEIRRALEPLLSGVLYNQSLYADLGTLQDLGLVDVDDLDGRTNSYGLTTAARRELAEYRAWAEMCYSSISRGSLTSS